MSRILPLIGATLAAAVVGCASAPIPYKNPVAVTPPSGPMAVGCAVTVFDASGSQGQSFAEGKATLESIVAAMPNGRYDAGHIHFGGRARETTGVSSFDRSRLASAARDASFLEGSTPLYRVLEREVPEALGKSDCRAAVVLISDGLVTDLAGRGGVEERTVAAARAVAEQRGGKVCFHAVQSGDSAEGAALLRSISGVTNCGSFRNASSLSTASALQSFSRNVYLAAAPTPAPTRPPTRVAAKVVDSDGDGVVDPKDACPGTLKKARVDSRGCWTLKGLEFAVNGAAIESGYAARLAEDIEVLKANPGVRIRVDGHTDSDGSAAYNQRLSERRAASVRDRLVAAGLSASRFEVKGFGETRPVAPNDSPANKRRNRRVELTILD